MKVTTSKGETFEVDWMWGPVGFSGDLMLQMSDHRPLSDIAQDFEGVGHFCGVSEDERVEWDGYTAIKAIVRTEFDRRPDIVQITLTKPVEE